MDIAAYQERLRLLKEGLSQFPSHCILSAMTRRYMVLGRIEIDCKSCRRREECQERLERLRGADSDGF